MRNKKYHSQFSLTNEPKEIHYQKCWPSGLNSLDAINDENNSVNNYNQSLYVKKSRRISSLLN